MQIHRLLAPMLLTALAGALLAPLAPASAFERIAATNPGDPMAVQRYQLENGLTIYLTVNQEEPRFYAEIAVRAGSKHDPAETTGLAHYLEHLLFKGTTRMGTLDWEAERPHIERIAELYEEHFRETDPERRAELWNQINAESDKAGRYAVPNELDRLFKAMGATEVNAHTWHEETVYRVNLPSNRVPQWLAIEAERFREPVLRLFQTELEIVYEEMNRALDNRHRLLREAVQELLYKVHPYGQQTTLGDPEHLKNPSIRNIERFYETYYVPNNMAIMISGDIDPEETVKLIAEHFGAWEARPLPEPEVWEEAPLEGREFVEVVYEGEEQVLLAFRTVPQSHPDADALILADMILDNAAAGLINLNLNQQQRVRSAGAYPMQLNDHGAQFFHGVPKEGQSLEEVEELLLEQIALLREGEFEDWILEAIINDFKKNLKSSLEDNNARVAIMRRSYIAHKDWDDTVAQIARMEELTREDVIRVANTYFGDDYVAGFRRDAPHEVLEVEKPELASIEIDPARGSEFAREIMAMPVEPIEPRFVDPAADFRVVRDPLGVTYYHAPNPINDVFSFSISIDAGTHEDNRLALAAALLDKSGTERLSPEELSKAWYRLGTDFSISAGDNETVIALRGLDENLEASLELLFEVLVTPAAEPETLELLKANILKSREDAKRDPATIAGALVQYSRYGEDSYFLRMLPSEAVMAQDREALFEVIRGLLGYERTVSYAGTHALEEVRAMLDRIHPVAEALAPPPPYRYLRVQEPESTAIHFVQRDAAQANIRLEFGGVDYDPAITVPVQLFNNYFAGGMTGIVFQELREARALAYVVGARYVEASRTGDQNIMLGVIQTQTDKTPEAVAAFIELLDNLPQSPERFAVARESLEHQYRTGTVGFRDVIGTVRVWERRGLEPDPRAQRFPEVLEADLDQIVGFHREHLADRPKLISIVGDRERIDWEALQELGDITELTTSDIFVD